MDLTPLISALLNVLSQEQMAYVISLGQFRKLTRKKKNQKWLHSEDGELLLKEKSTINMALSCYIET